MKEEEKIKRFKGLIAVNEVTQANIKRLNDLRNRQLVIIPYDSKYFKDFQQWSKEHPGRYDDKRELSPIYMSGKNADIILDALIEEKEKFIKPHKEELTKILSNAEPKYVTNANKL